MNQQETIRLLYESEGKSLREISEITKHDFRTVQKYAYREDWRPAAEEALRPENYKVLGPYIPIIDGWLEEDKKAPRKQRHTGKRVFERLRTEHKFKGSYDSVKRYLRRKREAEGRMSEGYLPLEHPPCHAQVDFGSFAYYDCDGTQRGGHTLIVSFPYSNAGWMQVFPAENQECLLEGLKRIFYHIGGVPHRLRCDNMTTAVAQVLNGRERVVSDGFRRFMLHHRFQAEFCNPASGNEKGSVENKVGYTRRNMLVPVPMIEDFEAFNETLLARCDADHDREHYRQKVSIAALWEEERGQLLNLPEYAYEVFRYESFAVGKTGFVTIDTNRYGVSPELAGRIVQAKLWFDRIEVFHDHQRLKTFRRNYGRNQECLDWRDYLPALTKKPNAATETKFFGQMPALWQRHLKAVQGAQRKSALLLLSEIVRDGNDDLCDEALRLASQQGLADTESIRQCYYFISRPEFHPQPLQLVQKTPGLADYRPDLSAYDALSLGISVGMGVSA
jgi:transposase